jgi:hypothetical protein
MVRVRLNQFPHSTRYKIRDVSTGKEEFLSSLEKIFQCKFD